MTKNLIVNGCSYTDDRRYSTWATHIGKRYKNYTNLGRGGAGNDYIALSTVEYIESSNPDPKDTLVIVMWSSIGKKDVLISGENYFKLKDDYPYLASNSTETYYLFSGGLTHSWLDNKETKKMFWEFYRNSDPLSLCKESLFNFILLENYLTSKGYKYLFTPYANCWDEQQESTMGGDYSIGYFCNQDDTQMYRNFDFSHWYIDQCLADYAKERNELNHTWHPVSSCHERYASEVLTPLIHNIHV